MGELEERNKSVVRQLGEALNRHRMDLLDDLVAADFVRQCQATPFVTVRNLDEFKRFLRDDWAGVPDGHSSVQLLLAEGDFVALYWTYADTQTEPLGPLPPSGKTFQVDVSGIFRVAAGKVAELWVTWDNLAVLTQLGGVQPPAQASPSR